MTEWDDSQSGDGIKELRKKFKEQAKLIKELQDEREKFQLRDRDSDVRQALADRGLDPRVAKFYPKDAPLDTTSIDAWVDENKDILGTRQIVSGNTPDDSTLTDSERRGYQAINDIAAYEAGLSMDLKSRMDKIEYDPMNPEKAQNELFDVLREFEGYLNQ
jgi:hypothetical protein